MLKRTIQRLNKALKLQKLYRDKHGFGWTPYDQDVSIQLEKKQALEMHK